MPNGVEHRRRRVLVPQALGGDEFLRVTWHRELDVVVFSQWSGATCVAAIPVRVADLSEVVELTTTALVAHVVEHRGASGPAPWSAPGPLHVLAADATSLRSA